MRNEEKRFQHKTLWDTAYVKARVGMSKFNLGHYLACVRVRAHVRVCVCVCMAREEPYKTFKRFLRTPVRGKVARPLTTGLCL